MNTDKLSILFQPYWYVIATTYTAGDIANERIIKSKVFIGVNYGTQWKNNENVLPLEEYWKCQMKPNDHDI